MDGWVGKSTREQCERQYQRGRPIKKMFKQVLFDSPFTIL